MSFKHGLLDCKKRRKWYQTGGKMGTKCETVRFGRRKGPFQDAKEAVSQCETASFADPESAFRGGFLGEQKQRELQVADKQTISKSAKNSVFHSE